MPALRSIEEPARQTPIVAEVDVVVAGGGPAGFAAALAAACEGARTLLVERYGYLGGMITGAHVIAILGAGDGIKPVARGITRELYERLERLGAATPIRGCGDYRVDAEVFKWQAQDMLREAGCALRLHTLACEPVIKGNRVAGIVTESKSGREAMLARVAIDATADADLAYRAGCACENQTHEVTLVVRIAGVDQEEVEAFRHERPEAYDAVIAEACGLNGGALPGRNRLLKGVDVTNAEALTEAEVRLRDECFRSLAYLRAHMPGYEGAYVAETQPQLGVRLSRRVRGRYVLRDDDLRASRHFVDGIARLGVYFPDWGPNYAIKGLAYDVPYRCLVPESVDGLLVAGRCISCDAIAGNTMRLIVPCLATGQAAGVAAAIAAREGCEPREVDSAQLRERLRAQDVHLG